MKPGKLLAAALSALMILPLAAGCAGKADGLTILGKKSDLEKTYMVRVFDLYEKATGEKLRVEAVEDGEFEKEAAARFAKGEGPDILLHFHNADLDRFDAEADFLPLNDQPWVSDLTDSARAYCEDADGNLLGLPFWENSVSGCYYNKTILDSLGLDPASTQAEFDMLCEALAGIGKTPVCWPADGCSWMPQFALDPVFADDPATLEALNAGTIDYADIPAVTDMVTWIAGAARSGWFGDDYLKTGWEDISPALSSGEAVMAFIWDTWFYTDFTPGKYTVDDFALMPVFMGTVSEGTYEGGNLNMMMVNKQGGRVDEALAFLAFCAAPENYNAAFDGIATVNCFQGQTTNIQSPMVTAAQGSVAARQRVSTASSRVRGYSAEDTLSALNALLRGKTDIPACVSALDRARKAAIEEGKG